MPLRDWRGDEIFDEIQEATKEGIDATMALCVQEAKQRVPVRTATLQGSIQLRPAKLIGGDIVGRWGSFTVRYAIFVEMGTGRMSAQPYLRPSADHNYPKLPRLIHDAFKRLRR